MNRTVLGIIAGVGIVAAIGALIFVFTRPREGDIIPTAPGGPPKAAMDEYRKQQQSIQGKGPQGMMRGGPQRMMQR